MKLSSVSICVLAALACAGSARAEIPLDSFAGFKIGLEGQLQVDGYEFNNDRADLNGVGSGDGDDSEYGVRRAEVVLKAKGEIFDWTLGYDFEGQKFLDANIKKKIAHGTLAVGQFKQPNGLESLSSSKFNDFISKSMTTNLFGLGRRLGAGYSQDHGHWGFAGGWFGRELTRNRARGTGLGLRGYWLPVQNEQGFFHLGASLVSQDTDSDALRLRSRPDADFATVRLIDSGTLSNTDRINLIGLEALWVHGPIKLQSEYIAADVDRYAVGTTATGRDYRADSAYVSGLWNVTGESWTYKNGVIGAPEAATSSRGVWQLSARVDHANLDDGPVTGGKETNLTLGVNCYWRSNFKLSFNYVDVRSDRRGISDDPSILEARAQLYW